MGRKTVSRKAFSAFKSTVSRCGMFCPGDRVLAACSGGPDSMALVALLLRLREEIALDIRVAHFNHRLRPQARDDEAFVQERAGVWALPLTSASKNVRLHASRERLNLEEAGRALRYEFLKRTALKSGATVIATGHNLNDQAETVLMRLMRGSGLTGLGGIAPVSAAGPARIVRPLIEMSREGILSFLREEGIPFREDETNLDRRFLRNRVRMSLLPDLEKNYEPRIVEHLARLAEIAREEEGLLEIFVRGLSREFIVHSGNETGLDVKTLATLHSGLARRVAREFLRELKGDLRSVSFHDVDALLRLSDGKARPFGKGLVLRRERGVVSPRRKPGVRAAPYEILWDGEGILPVKPAELTFGGNVLKGRPPAGLRVDDRVRAVVDRDKIEFPLLIRARKPGDRYRPIGAPGRKKLKEVLRAKGIAEDERDRLPVFLSRGEIVWAPGLPVAEKFRVDEDTEAVFIIDMIRAGKTS